MIVHFWCFECDREGSVITSYRQLQQWLYANQKTLCPKCLKTLRNMKYPDYLLTRTWQDTRQIALQWYGFKCQHCDNDKRLHIHHETYERLGEELMDDLIVLCKDCHAEYHDELSTNIEQFIPMLTKQYQQQEYRPIGDCKLIGDIAREIVDEIKRRGIKLTDNKKECKKCQNNRMRTVKSSPRMNCY